MSNGGDLGTATRIATNCIEKTLDDAQLVRAVAYFMMQHGVFELATQLFDLVRDLKPAEPHSHIDLSLCKFFALRTAHSNGGRSNPSRVGVTACVAEEGVTIEQLQEAMSHMQEVMEGEWPSRFNEIEAPCLFMLNWMYRWGCEVLGGAPDIVWPVLLSKDLILHGDMKLVRHLTNWS